MTVARPPLAFGVAVGCVAAATLFAELALTRIFSVLFYYHFSFFAVGLAMSGLAIGGLWVARWPVRTLPGEAFGRRLATLALAGAGVGLAELAAFVLFPPSPTASTSAAESAIRWLPLFVLTGGFLGAAFARRPEWIGGLYAWDLLAASLAGAATIPILRFVPGPAALFTIPLLLGTAAASIQTARRAQRAAGLALALGSALASSVAVTRADPLIRLRDDAPAARVVFERWNEYSRIQGRIWPAKPDELDLVIDRSASTQMRRLPPGPGGTPPQPDSSWLAGTQALAFSLGRPLRRVAIIGVGGGRDLLPPLARGATEVVGFEYNRILVDVLRRDYVHFNAVARRPEVRLVNAEGRSGLRRDRGRYDVVQASLTDTWAATAAGGFALAENGLYTIEGWITLLDALKPSGVLTMTRWHLPTAPAETHRLVSLATAALAHAGISDLGHHIVLVAGPPLEPLVDALFGPVRLATILVSREPFTAAELARLRPPLSAAGGVVLAEPGAESSDTVLAALLDPARRDAAIRSHRFDISPPTDLRPYFFLQLRLSDVSGLLPGDVPSSFTDVAFHAVRVLVAFLLVALCLTGAVLLLSRRRGHDALPTVSRGLRLYFVAIGLGYMLVQLGLHQRLTLVLGHPTYALALVLCAMLLGTGLGSALSGRVTSARAERLAWYGLPAVVTGVVVAFPAMPLLEAVPASALRLGLVGGGVLGVGTVLGLGFPLGVRLTAPLGERAIQRMWAINGAASIAGSAVAALVGLTAGSRVTVAAGLLCYLAAASAAVFVRRGTAILDR